MFEVMRERFEAFFPQRAETLGKVGVTLAGLACQVRSSSFEGSGSSFFSTKSFEDSGSYLIIVIFFTLTQFLENKIYTEKRQFFALNL